MRFASRSAQLLVVLVGMWGCADSRPSQPFDAKGNDAGGEGNDAGLDQGLPSQPLDAKREDAEGEGNDAGLNQGLQVFPREHDFGLIVPGQAPQTVTFTVSAAGTPIGNSIVLVDDEALHFSLNSDCTYPGLRPDKPTCSFMLRPTVRTPEGVHKLKVWALNQPHLQAEVTVKLSRPAGADPSLALVGHWSFDGHLRDASGNGNHGAFMVGRTISTAIQQTAAFVPAKHGLGIKFNNPVRDDQAFPTEWAEVRSSPTLQDIGWVMEFSATMWLRLDVEVPTDDSGLRFAISQASEDGGNHELLGAGLRGAHAVGLEQGLAHVLDDEPFASGSFHHVAVTSDVFEMVLYVDGMERARTNRYFPIILAETSLFFGADQNRDTVNNGWNGVIDEVRLYASVLSHEQVLADMNR